MLKQPSTYVIEADGTTLAKMAEFYHDGIVKAPNEYVSFLIHGDAYSVTAYKKTDSKGLHKIVFQGPQGQYECSIWSHDPIVSSLKKPALSGTSIAKKAIGVKPSRPGLCKWKDQIGSDEVGTGDFFGPVCVCAAYVDNAGFEEIKRLGVTDSKKMDDDYIRQIGPRLIRDFAYSQLSLDNEKYNEVHRRGLNMNAIKAQMHNRCLLNLKKKYPKAILCQDQFAEEGLYYSYLRSEKEIARGIFFSIKGELVFPSVALASVIARYSFLRKMEEIGKKYGERIPLGAGADVDSFARQFVKAHGLAELKRITKESFANMKRVAESEPLL